MAVNCAAVVAAVLVVVVVVVIVGWRVLNWVWLTPRKFEKQLREQGLKGNSYKLLSGDLKEMATMSKEAKAKPIGLSDDIVPHVMPFFHKSVIKHGQNFFAWLGPKPMVNIVDPEIIKEILSKYNQFQKPKGQTQLVRGLIAQDGEKWVKHRKIINPAFHVEKLKHMLPAFYLSCIEMIGKWEEIVSKEEGCCELDVWPYLQIVSADVISRTAFGSNYEEGRRIFELQKEQAELAMEASRSIYIPGSRFLPTKRNKRMKEIAKDVRASIKSIIDKKLAAMKVGETASNDDLLGILLESNNKEIEHHGNKNSGMSIEEVIEECYLFYFAGQETTANLLVWTMVLLSQHQLWQAKAREEVLQVFGNKKPDYNGLNHLKIVTMILNEVLRLYPPAAAVMARTIHEEMKVGEFTLPAGVFIQVPIMLVHHNLELWGDDAKEFKPERFSEGVSKVTKGQASFIPFGGGPRICIGQNFAMLEAKLIVAMILQRFSFALSTSYSHAPQIGITLRPQYGAHLVLQRL
uniref:Cytochrome P450 72A555 n=1 Tax=Platycodon grandiflorus TaxID=94286 RepID=A0A1V1FRN6_PLAGD|nr:cytochrome P450 72A555 [Platycodon grandiflorus]